MYIFSRLSLSPPVQLIESIDPASAALCHDQAACLAWAMRAIPSTSHTISRSRYAKDALEKAVRQGVKQYVILGAGMDTFAFRRREMLEQKLQVFEVDHPATQGFKRERLSELNWEIPINLYFVPVDFTKESLSAALARSSYDPHSQSFFSWMGVTYYLPREVVFTTLTSYFPSGEFKQRSVADILILSHIPASAMKCSANCTTFGKSATVAVI